MTVIVYWPRIPLGKVTIVPALEAMEDVELRVVPDIDGLKDALQGAEGLILPDTNPADARRVCDLIAAPGVPLRWMHFVTAGQDGFQAAGMPEGVAVTRPGLGVSPGVAEHAMALLLGLVRQVPDAARATDAKDWSRAYVPRMRTLEGARIGVYGSGKIGGEFAARARPFGAEVIGISRSGQGGDAYDACWTMEEAATRLEKLDMVLAALPLTEDTRAMFNAAFFAALPKGALFVNVARGGVVDQAALADALGSGQLGGAALDVTDPEPLPADHPLWDAPNLLISAHVAGFGNPHNQQRIGDDVVRELARLRAEGVL